MARKSEKKKNYFIILMDFEEDGIILPSEILLKNETSSRVFMQKKCGSQVSRLWEIWAEENFVEKRIKCFVLQIFGPRNSLEMR